MAPSAVVKGEKVKSAPPVRSRDPQPIRGDDVGGAALQADRGRVGAGERHHVELDALGLVETVPLDGVEDPTDSAEFQNADLDLGRRIGGLTRSEGSARVAITNAKRAERNGAPSALFFLPSQFPIRHEMSGQLRCHRKCGRARPCRGEARNWYGASTARVAGILYPSRQLSKFCPAGLQFSCSAKQP